MSNEVTPTPASFDTVKTEIMNLISTDVESAAKIGFDFFNAEVARVREARASDTPSIKKAAESFEPSDELAEEVEAVADEVRGLVHGLIQEAPFASVLIYEFLKEYASDSVKIYRDAVLRGYLSEEDDSESVEISATSLDDMKALRTLVEGVVHMATLQSIEVDLPRKKNGNLNFASLNRYEGTSSEDSDVTVTKFRYYVDGELSERTRLAELALWELSSASVTVRASDIHEARRAASGNESMAKDYVVNINGHELRAEAVRG
jgi:hypothetical protein